MSVFYGTLQGCRGEATRCGSRDSGIRTSAQSYDGSVITDLRYNDDEKLMVRISTSDYSTCCYGDLQFKGSLDEFKQMCDLYRQIKDGKLKVSKVKSKK